MRNSLPNARIMIHQPSGGVTGQATDIKIQAEEILKLKKQINLLYEKHTGMPFDKVESSLERDNFMTPQEALEFGLIDKVLTKPSNTSSKSPEIDEVKEVIVKTNDFEYAIIFFLERMQIMYIVKFITI